MFCFYDMLPDTVSITELATQLITQIVCNPMMNFEGHFRTIVLGRFVCALRTSLSGDSLLFINNYRTMEGIGADI